jgi:pimeloyl-ACP methyl ester carboxylesterase
VPCFDDQKCARLSLPLDYLTEDDGAPKTEIALRMIPATDKENYLGPILVNPGGPGDSGTQFIGELGANISAAVGPQFDIVGFDPRGTGATTPAVQCYATESQQRIWQLQQGSFIVGLNATDGSIPYEKARENALGQKCAQYIGGSDVGNYKGNTSEWAAGRFMSTASVATDMLHITQKMGFEKLQYIGYVSTHLRNRISVSSVQLSTELWNGNIQTR